MATSQQTGMRLDEFYYQFLKPHGFVLERDKGRHARIYRHELTGVMFNVGQDEGAFRMSPVRVDAARKDLQAALAQIDLISMRQMKDKREDGAAMAVVVAMKVCPSCGRNLAADQTEYYANKRNRDQLSSYCRKCTVEKTRNMSRHGRYVTDAQWQAMTADTHTQNTTPVPVREAAAEAVTQAHALAESDSTSGAPEGDAVTSVAVRPLHIVEPITTTRRQPERIRLADFMERDGAVRDDDPLTCFVSFAIDFVVVRSAGKLYILTPDAGPGEALTERSAAYILRLLAGANAAEIEGVLFL